MMNNDNEKRYMELTAHTEQAICELMERSTTLKKAQRDQQISMAHGVLSLWARLARDLSTSLLPEFSPKVEADHRRMKELIRRPPPPSNATPSSRFYAGRTPPTRRSYGLHWHRIQRAVRMMSEPTFGMRLAEDQAADWHEFWEDVATMNFIHLHQLKDWFPEAVSELANAYINDHVELQICADLANTAKHAWLNPDRGGARAQMIVGRGRPVITIPPGAPRASGIPKASVKITVSIDREGENTQFLNAVKLVRECFQLWRQFIRERVAESELDDVAYFPSVWINEGGRRRLRRSGER